VGSCGGGNPQTPPQRELPPLHICHREAWVLAASSDFLERPSELLSDHLSLETGFHFKRML
jgi:hypothetical protein